MLQGKVVLVTGAARGIGRAYARTLAQQGATVVLNDLAPWAPPGGAPSDDPLDELVRSLTAAGYAAVGQRSDVGTWDGAREAVDTALSTFGRIDGLVNNAGTYTHADVADLEESVVDKELSANLSSTIACSRHACAYWRAESRAGRRRTAAIVNTSSGAFLKGSPGSAVYAAAKAAIVSFTQAASLEAGDYGVRVNAIAPSGWTTQAARSGLLGDPEVDVPFPEDQDPSSARNPMRNGPLVAWLLSDRSAHVSGQMFRMRHGYVRLLEPFSCGPWAQLVQPDGSWDPDALARVMDASVIRCRLPYWEREYPDRPTEPYPRRWHG